ncbi:hypothetical protein PSCICP_19560 [Pseudomonas cichorii]|uniref:Uncharacterized protein n=1 Tax=Pseudomonas cichorii TaxID=36746 RepID=A0ABQ1DM24_PSECI|nr:hypothetical protein PSCICP_19560 [Pseudomonas cichorii]
MHPCAYDLGVYAGRFCEGYEKWLRVISPVGFFERIRIRLKKPGSGGQFVWCVADPLRIQ